MAADEPRLPERYGLDRIVLMARDPRWLYAFWEVTTRTAADAMHTLRAPDEEGGTLHLRLYQVGHDPRPVADYAVDPVGARYLRAPLPDETYQAEIGIAWQDRYRPLAHSRPVRVPPAGPLHPAGASNHARTGEEDARKAEALYVLAAPPRHPASSFVLAAIEGEPGRVQRRIPAAAEAFTPEERQEAAKE